METAAKLPFNLLVITIDPTEKFKYQQAKITVFLQIFALLLRNNVKVRKFA